jgi:hypothetical protein
VTWGYGRGRPCVPAGLPVVHADGRGKMRQPLAPSHTQAIGFRPRTGPKLVRGRPASLQPPEDADDAARSFTSAGGGSYRRQRVPTTQMAHDALPTAETLDVHRRFAGAELYHVHPDGNATVCRDRRRRNLPAAGRAPSPCPLISTMS